jgi:2',3'-cyclic-nucleotide 2'-phosphodiesterase (5'-nucleotidase family)
MKKILASIALLFAACAPSASSPAATATPAASATLGPICQGAVSRAPMTDRPATLPTVPGATRITMFFATHTHGELVRPDRVTFAHYAGKVAELRRGLPDPTKSLFVGNGDDVSWNVCGVRTDGLHVIDSFNAAGLDANTYGFNEVTTDESSITAAQMRDLIQRSRFTWVSANVLEVDKSDVFARTQGARRWIVKDVGGVRVGLTGLIVPSPAQGFIPRSYGRDLSVIDPVQAMREVVPLMRRDGAQVIVVLSHMDIETMERVAAEVDGIDAILGAHVWEPSQAKLVGRTILADGHDNMHQIGQLDLFVRDGRVADHAFAVHTVRLSSPVHAGVSAILERHVPTTK